MIFSHSKKLSKILHILNEIFFLDRYRLIRIRETVFSVFRGEKSYFCSNFWRGVNFKALSKKYVNFNNFGQFFLKFVTKFPNFWKISLSFLVWETILTSKNLFWLEIFPLSYKERRIKKSNFKQTQLASLQVELGKANTNKASFRQIDLNLRATLVRVGWKCTECKNLKNHRWLQVAFSIKILTMMCLGHFRSIRPS